MVLAVALRVLQGLEVLLEQMVLVLLALRGLWVPLDLRVLEGLLGLLVLKVQLEFRALKEMMALGELQDQGDMTVRLVQELLVLLGLKVLRVLLDRKVSLGPRGL